MQATTWATSIEAFVICVLIWAGCSLLSSPLLVIRRDRSNGRWHGSKFVYNEPLIVCVSVWTVSDNGKHVEIDFVDAEPNSLVDYYVELDSPSRSLSLVLCRENSAHNGFYSFEY